jgi:hypothetical protein
MQPSHKKSRVPFADNIHLQQPGKGLSPYQAAARRKLIASAERDAERFVFAFDVQRDHAPALRSVIDEMGALLAARIGGKNTQAQEAALTRAAIGLGALKKAILPQVPAEDPDYRAEIE